MILVPTNLTHTPAVIYRWAAASARRHAGGVNLDLDALAATANAIAGSAVGWLMAVRIGESALGSLTPAEVMADPFGTVGALIDLPGYMQRALPATAKLASLSPREMLYLAAYLRQATATPRTPLLLRALFATAVGMWSRW